MNDTPLKEYQRHLHGLLGKVGLKNRPVKLAGLSLLTGRRIRSSMDLTANESRSVLLQLESLRRGPATDRRDLQSRAANLARLQQREGPR